MGKKQKANVDNSLAKPDKIMLVLLHGFPFNKEIWTTSVKFLADDFHVVAVDLPGYGDCAHLSACPTIAEGADWLYNFLKEKSIKKMVLAGHSMGGYVALEFAKKYPKSVKGLILIHSVATADNDDKKATRDKVIELIKKGGKQRYIAESVAKTFSEKFRNTQKETVDFWINECQNVDDQVLISSLSAMKNREENLKFLQHAAIPIQWIAGEHDEIIKPALIMEQAQQSARSSVNLLSESGHMSMIEEPMQLAQTIQEFVTFCNS